MNIGTKIRTVLAVATSLNTALLATDLTGFNNHTLDTIYTVVSIILNFIIVACVTYYNNDYTDAGDMGTKVCRQIKEGQANGDLTVYDDVKRMLEDKE